jgi:dienelactone hydrolase
MVRSRTARTRAGLGLAAMVVAATLAILVPARPVEAQTNGCPTVGANFGGTGPFAVTVQAESVTTYYSPTNLGSNGCARHPVILWGNGTFTTPTVYDGLLRHLASHGFVVAAANTSNAGTGTEMLQGLTQLTQWNGQAGNRFFQRVDVDRVGTTGHSQGGSGAMRAAQDPRVDTAFPVEGGFFNSTGLSVTVPTLFLAGETDTLTPGIRSAYQAAAATIPAAYAELAGAGHLVPLGDGGGFRPAITAWARWRLMGDATAGAQFLGASCGLCTSPAWSDYQANARLQQLGGGDPGPGPGPGPGACVQAVNSAHVQAGRATAFLIFAFAVGSNNYLGTTSATTSLRQTATSPPTWSLVTAC